MQLRSHSSALTKQERRREEAEEPKPDDSMVSDIKGKALAIILVLYNITLGIFIVLNTTNPLAALLAVSADFILLFYYFKAAIMDRLQAYQFKKSHAELIKNAMSEVKGVK